MLTQPGVLDDDSPAERSLGIACGHQWISAADAVVVYRDLGISPGMERGIERAALELVPVEYRTLPGWVAENPPRVPMEPAPPRVPLEPSEPELEPRKA